MDSYIKAKQHAERYLKKGDRILVCFSGGPDSAALLDILYRLSKSMGFKLSAAHFNHRLRGRDSSADALFCRKTCVNYGIKLYEAQADTKKEIKKSGHGPEKTARSLRYAFFLKTALKNKMNKIALAHTLDDNAETILFRFIKGAGPEGLSGIAESRQAKSGDFGVDLKGAKVDFIRPLLGETKKGIIGYLKKNRLGYRMDKSNEGFDYDRNRLRHKIIPLIRREINPSFMETIASGAGVFAADNDYLEKKALSAAAGCVRIRAKRAEISIKEYSGLDESIRYRVVRAVLERLLGGMRKVTKNLVFSIDGAIILKKRADLPLGLKIEPKDGEKSVISQFLKKV